MKTITKLLCVFAFMFIVVCSLGCESLNGPEGKYAYIVKGNELATLNFEKDKVTLTVAKEDKGTFDYTYEKYETDKYFGTIEFMIEDVKYTFEFDYKNKTLTGGEPIYNDGYSRVFKKMD